MELNFDRSAINKKLQIVPDETVESIPWLQKDVPKEFKNSHKKIDPFPGACIKTWTETGDKVFINVCHSKEILPPEDISDEKFSQLMTEEIPSFVIPMAIGLEKMAKDKDDIERPTFDILINTSYFEKCANKPHFWQFTTAAILESINDKYQKNIDTSKYVVLKNKKVIGSLDTFTIQDRKPKKPAVKKPLIQELVGQEIKSSLKKNLVTPKENLAKQSTNAKNQNQDSIKVIKTSRLQNYVIVKAEEQKSLIGLFYLPSSSITDLTIDVGSNRIIIENGKAESIIDMFLPQSINNSHVTANYDSKLHILKLQLPLMEN